MPARESWAGEWKVSEDRGAWACHGHISLAMVMAWPLLQAHGGHWQVLKEGVGGEQELL